MRRRLSKKNHCNFRLYEPRHENKSCSACRERVNESVEVLKVFLVPSFCLTFRHFQLGFFNDIIKDGGNVAAKYDENKRVRVLLVQTQTQFKALSEAKPNLFFTDTTFGTSLPFLILFLIRVTIEDSQRVDWVESESS